MAAIDYYTRGDLNWNDHPKCVDPMIRRLAIYLNDWCDNGEREDLIGPHLFTPVGTNDARYRQQRLKLIVQFAMDCAADARDATGTKHGLRKQWGADFNGAAVAAAAAGAAADDAAAVAAAGAAADAAASAVDAADDAAAGAAGDTYKKKLLQLILDLCAIGPPSETCSVKTKKETLRVVCRVEN
jgi:hypothetical protein